MDDHGLATQKKRKSYRSIITLLTAYCERCYGQRAPNALAALPSTAHVALKAASPQQTKKRLQEPNRQRWPRMA